MSLEDFIQMGTQWLGKRPKSQWKSQAVEHPTLSLFCIYQGPVILKVPSVAPRMADLKALSSSQISCQSTYACTDIVWQHQDRLSSGVKRNASSTIVVAMH